MSQNFLPPTNTDGRDIDLTVANLSGEAALQRADPHPPQGEGKTWDKAPTSTDPSYYNRPLLKHPVWKWTVPAYYFVGGAAGAALAMGAATQLDRSGRLDNLRRGCHWAGVIGCAISGGILINDLGRPERFHHMLRVFRPTSPMNMGVWIISIVSPSAAGAALFGNRRGVLKKIGDASGIVSGISGLAFATYTGVLISNTALPLWQESRHILPILFGASAMASAGSMFDIAMEDRYARRVAYTFGTVGRVAELAASYALERRLARVDPLIVKPLKRGVSGKLWKAAGFLTAASLLVSALPGKSRKKRVTAGVLGILGSLTMRYAIQEAGVASAADPTAVFRQQRSEPARAHAPA